MHHYHNIQTENLDLDLLIITMSSANATIDLFWGSKVSTRFDPYRKFCLILTKILTIDLNEPKLGPPLK